MPTLQCNAMHDLNLWSTLSWLNSPLSFHFHIHHLAGSRNKRIHTKQTNDIAKVFTSEINLLSTLVLDCACCPSWEHTGSHELTPRINNCLLSSLKRVDLFCVRAGKHLFSAYTALMQSHVQICKTFQYACMQGRRGGVQVGSKAASMDRKAIVVPRTNCLHFQDFINPCVNPFR